MTSRLLDVKKRLRFFEIYANVVCESEIARSCYSENSLFEAKSTLKATYIQTVNVIEFSVDFDLMSSLFLCNKQLLSQ